MRLLAFWSFKEITDFHTLSYTSTTEPLLFHIPEAWKIQEIRQDVGHQIGQEIGHQNELHIGQKIRRDSRQQIGLKKRTKSRI